MQPEPIPQSSPARFQGIVFWLLIALGLSGLVPCVLLPEWRQYESLAMAERLEAYHLGVLEELVERKRAACDALSDDPGVIARLARRELGYVRPEERTVRTVALSDRHAFADGAFVHSGFVETSDQVFALEPLLPPSIVASLVGVLPSLDYDAVFCDDDTQIIILTMSLALIVLALVLFGRTSRVLHGDRLNSAS